MFAMNLAFSLIAIGVVISGPVGAAGDAAHTG